MVPKGYITLESASTLPARWRRIILGLSEFMHSLGNTIKLTKKSAKEEFLLYLKLVGLGVGVVGALGYIIQFVASILRLTQR